MRSIGAGTWLDIYSFSYYFASRGISSCISLNHFNTLSIFSFNSGDSFPEIDSFVSWSTIGNTPALNAIFLINSAHLHNSDIPRLSSTVLCLWLSHSRGRTQSRTYSVRRCDSSRAWCSILNLNPQALRTHCYVSDSTGSWIFLRILAPKSWTRPLS